MVKQMEEGFTTFLIIQYSKEFQSKIKFKVYFKIISGFGRIIHSNGDYYEGEVKNSKANG